MDFIITEPERRSLLADARETIAARLEKREPRYSREEGLREQASRGESALARLCGAFVTLHSGKKLRGCIGRMTASLSLEETVRAMALEAAFGDPRFLPVGREEFPGCSIEISALSPMTPCPDPRSVKVGVHGLFLIHQDRVGVLLPQVPVEQGWGLDEYLDCICIKAGLPTGSCEAPGARLYTFTAIVFGEGD
jgi:AmmeMemoRadiSam system protein A